MKFIHSKRKEDFEILAKKNLYISRACQSLQAISQDEQKRMEYEAREKTIRDDTQGLPEATARGEQRGIEKNRAGGRAIGEQEKSIQTVKNHFRQGFRRIWLQKIDIDELTVLLFKSPSGV